MPMTFPTQAVAKALPWRDSREAHAVPTSAVHALLFWPRSPRPGSHYDIAQTERYYRCHRDSSVASRCPRRPRNMLQKPYAYSCASLLASRKKRNGGISTLLPELQTQRLALDVRMAEEMYCPARPNCTSISRPSIAQRARQTQESEWAYLFSTAPSISPPLRPSTESKHQILTLPPSTSAACSPPPFVPVSSLWHTRPRFGLGFT
ncbi:hypothetical protein B0H12DRAFT_476050 [Mycena haematopus]|nr:hypothetical protein B0H12DRAFT_476050 [Mycena haematopus]